jgi:hypothetical protein
LPDKPRPRECSPVRGSIAGKREGLQQPLAALRTDSGDLARTEAPGSMACGYQMAAKRVLIDLASMKEPWRKPGDGGSPFDAMLAEITSSATTTPQRPARLEAQCAGSTVETG